MFLRKKAKVLEVKDKSIMLEILESQACQNCKLDCKINKRIVLDTDANFKKGQIVEIRFLEKKFLILAFFVFLLPSILFVLLLFLFRELETVSFLLGVIGVSIYFFVLTFFLKTNKEFNKIEILE